ncbi:hypothetical protein MTR_2g099330 [Medicago truncatula]|uniref:Uncharacterized protein n=1 Tax=Medicago truncatula TaxID=3880 RepID=G7IS07_MEDTR|nr:hypothetical protein MTR_2g099330 [Medicago truncatula]
MFGTIYLGMATKPMPGYPIMCKCVSCDSRKRTQSEWERHTGSRAKKMEMQCESEKHNATT